MAVQVRPQLIADLAPIAAGLSLPQLACNYFHCDYEYGTKSFGSKPTGAQTEPIQAAHQNQAERADGLVDSQDAQTDRQARRTSIGFGNGLWLYSDGSIRDETGNHIISLALPKYVDGSPTYGTGVAGDGRVYDLTSGKKKRDADLLKIVNDRLREAGRLTGTATSGRASDVEQKFAAIMIRDGINSAVVVINNPNGPCSVELGCDDVLNTLLGDRQLTVYYPDGNGGWTSQPYGGAR